MRRKIPIASCVENGHVTLTGVVQSKVNRMLARSLATQFAAADPDLPIAGVVLLGYPLHPPGKPDQRRDKHLPAVGRPMLFIQGTRDAFGTPTELAPVLDAIGPSASIHVVSGGDHSLKLARKDPAAQAAVYDEVQRTIVEWM